MLLRRIEFRLGVLYSMGLIIIPADYENQRVVPICVRELDCYGRRIGRGWITGCEAVASRVRHLSRRFLHDEWRASEVADETLQGLAKKRGDDYGSHPARLILSTAQWLVRDKIAGDQRARRGLNVALFDRMHAQLEQSENWGQRVEAKVFCDRLLEALQTAGREDLVDMMSLYLEDPDTTKIRAQYGITRSGLSRLFWDGLRRFAGLH